METTHILLWAYGAGAIVAFLIMRYITVRKLNDMFLFENDGASVAMQALLTLVWPLVVAMVGFYYASQFIDKAFERNTDETN